MSYFSMLQSGSTYNISYTNADGITTERKITVLEQWFSHGNEYTRAYCWSRSEHRIFRLDRINEAVITDFCQSPAPEPIISREEINRSAAAIVPTTERKDTKPAAAYVSNKRPAKNHPVLATMSLLFLVIGLWAGFSEDTGKSSTSYTAKKAAAAHKTVKPLPRKTIAWEQAIQQRKTLYSINTGFNNTQLLELYASADTDYDNVLSWTEIDHFQERIYRMFNYYYNDTALTPVDFLSQGGGDCEDWSIFTCGMLRFWDYRSYVGVIDAGYGGGLHAIALFYKKTPPANKNYSYYHLKEPCSFYNLTLPAGCYLPIDYDKSGSFTNASKPDSPLRNVYRPEEIYGSYM